MNWPGEAIWQQVMALGLPSLASFSVEILPEIDSTNSELMRRARAGRTEPTLLDAWGVLGSPEPAIRSPFLLASAFRPQAGRA
jgi:hypothetical protein